MNNDINARDFNRIADGISDRLKKTQPLMVALQAAECHGLIGVAEVYRHRLDRLKAEVAALKAEAEALGLSV